MTALESHNAKVQEITNNYRQKGYDTIIEPEPDRVPDFLGGLQPDIIAQSPNDRVIIEVKSRSGFRNSDSARRMADLVANQTGWRFELVLLSGKDDLPEQKGTPLSLQQAKELLVLATQENLLVNDSIHFVTAWIASEALMRSLAEKHSLSDEIIPPGALLKKLLFVGAISREQYTTLDEMLSLRNQVVHGFFPTNISRVHVSTLVTTAQELINEIERLNTFKTAQLPGTD